MYNTIKIIENGEYKAYVNKFTPLGEWNGEYSVVFSASVVLIIKSVAVAVKVLRNILH